MDLASLCGSGRVCYLGGRRFLVRPLSLDGLGSMLAWLDDVLPGRENRTGPPHVSDPEAQEALRSSMGFLLLVHLGLRDQGITFDIAVDLVTQASDEERARFILVVFARRRSYQPGVGSED